MAHLDATSGAGKNMAIDPVCGMKVAPGENVWTTNHNGKSYWFCARECREAFEKNPGKYIKRKGWFGRFLDRMSNANEKQFGSGGPSCCN